MTNQSQLQEIATKLYSMNHVMQKAETSVRCLTDAFVYGYENTITEDQFWDLIKKMKDQIKEAEKRTGKGSVESVKNGIHNFFCYNFDDNDLIAFSRMYKAKVSAMYKLDSLWEKMGLGDDGWGDFCDSIILNGKSTYTKLISEQLTPAHKEKFNRAIKGWSEMYVHSSIMEKLMTWLPMHADEILNPEKKNKNRWDDDYEPREQTVEQVLSQENEQLKMKIAQLEKKIRKAGEALGVSNA